MDDHEERLDHIERQLKRIHGDNYISLDEHENDHDDEDCYCDSCTDKEEDTGPLRWDELDE